MSDGLDKQEQERDSAVEAHAVGVARYKHIAKVARLSAV